ncbi:uncharacterized protein EV420DRAFT_1634031 [Desarmillaria tabescens]|uniref:DUF7330 domain-containing protein n=1 Tax=Armillaria tabescens TaxID=1929756 RepID=A0AA39NPW8_ARMTA|nr:uncharacterized protein EV420DRAFT_1634031 [Desarmillaria tabescens]KAK0469611.1 hypothetical protein EV420DRAFT_1634031 [Desarmillaria tabescens]
MAVLKTEKCDSQPTILTGHEDPPPNYEELSTPTINSPTSVEGPDVALFNTKASNYVHIQRYLNGIQEAFFIDPTLRVPRALLPSLKAGETDDTRRNLNLEATMGPIDVDVTIVYKEPQSSETQRRVILVVKNNLGPIKMRLHAADSPDRHPLYLRVCSQTGPMDISLPRSFVGVITIATGLGPVELSKHLSQFITPLSDAGKGRRRYFIGDLSTSPFNDDPKEWCGDEVLIESNLGPVHLKRDDE